MKSFLLKSLLVLCSVFVLNLAPAYAVSDSVAQERMYIQRIDTSNNTAVITLYDTTYNAKILIEDLIDKATHIIVDNIYGNRRDLSKKNDSIGCTVYDYPLYVDAQWRLFFLTEELKRDSVYSFIELKGSGNNKHNIEHFFKIVYCSPHPCGKNNQEEASTSMGTDVGSEKEPSPIEVDWTIILLSVLLVLAIVTIWLVYRLRKESERLQDMQRHKQASLPKVSQINQTTPSVTQENLDAMQTQIINTITNSQGSIQEVLNRLSQLSEHFANLASTQISSKLVEQQTVNIDTDQCYYDSGQFKLATRKIENSPIHIYQKGNQYYYTLVDKQEIRTSILSNINAMEAFIEVNNFVLNATHVVVEQEGTLNRLNDTSWTIGSKLKVRLV